MRTHPIIIGDGEYEIERLLRVNVAVAVPTKERHKRGTTARRGIDANLRDHTEDEIVGRQDGAFVRVERERVKVGG